MADLDGQVAVDVGPARRLGDAELGLPVRDLDLHDQRVAGHDGPLPLDAVDAREEEDGARLGALHLQADDARELREGLDLHDAGHDRPVGEVAAELRLVERDLLDPDGGLAGLVGDDLVDEREGVAVRQDLP